MVELKAMTMEELQERLIENGNWLRELRMQKQTIEDQIWSASFSSDDIRTELDSRREPLRLVVANG